MHIFSDIQLQKCDFIHTHPLAKLSSLVSFQVKELAIVWSYYSGKIEGNTYSYVETELLLKEGITPINQYENAKQLKNLFNTFIFVVEQISKQKKEFAINEKNIFQIHSMITDELLHLAQSGFLRDNAVFIHGTNYVPPMDKETVKKEFNAILRQQKSIRNPFEKAIFLHCHMARLQPFFDGNKRTARMLESTVLMNHNIVPVYSTNDADITNYRKGLVHFYETQDYSLYAEYFLNRQINRLNEISSSQHPKYNLTTNQIYQEKKPATEKLMAKAKDTSHKIPSDPTGTIKKTNIT